MVSLLIALILVLQAPLEHGPRTEKKVALTFDACPTRLGPGYDEAITKVLRERNIPATMFLTGRWVETHEAEARELAQHFEIGNHGYRHDDASQGRLGYDEALADIGRAQRVIHRVTGKIPRLYRPPAVLYNDEVLRAAADLGLRTVLYDVASGDPDKRLQAEAIVRYVVWKTKPGSIVIFHINGKGWTTAKTLPEIVKQLGKRGYRFVTVGDLVR
jgi:peptidoglycan/xylan/chitin deacetylase (PgdA/CDA1 family)